VSLAAEREIHHRSEANDAAACKGISTAWLLSEKISSLPPDLKQIVAEEVDRLLAE
jgi:hypothetical protein